MTDAPPSAPPYGPPPGYKLKRKKRFYQRWLFWIPVAIIAIIIASVSATAGGSNSQDTAADSTASTAATSAPSAAPSPGVSNGLGSHNAAADVTVGKLKAKKITGDVAYYYVPVVVTNHSSKRSDYVVTVALESADGKQQIDTATVLVQNLEAGQSKRDEGDFLSTTKAPKGAQLVLQEVERTASV